MHKLQQRTTMMHSYHYRARQGNGINVTNVVINGWGITNQSALERSIARLIRMRPRMNALWMILIFCLLAELYRDFKATQKATEYAVRMVIRNSGVQEARPRREHGEQLAGSGNQSGRLTVANYHV